MQLQNPADTSAEKTETAAAITGPKRKQFAFWELLAGSKYDPAKANKAKKTTPAEPVNNRQNRRFLERLQKAKLTRQLREKTDPFYRAPVPYYLSPDNPGAKIRVDRASLRKPIKPLF